MHVVRRKGWEIPERLATPEAMFLDRRGFLAGLGVAGALAVSGRRALADDADPSASLYPAQRNPAYTLDRDVTPEKYNLNYNNFYEFSTSKHLDASALKIRPWTVKLDGMVEKEQTVDIDSLIKAMGLEERLYRHRCVEAWSMAIPWTGLPLKKLVDFAKPLSSATYVRFETFLDKKMAPGQRTFSPWPYVEGLTMAEATNDLAFIATGAYGKPISKSAGRADPAGDPLEIRLQVDQVDRARVVYRQAAGHILGDAGSRRIRVLGQCQSGCGASPLEPGPGDLPERRTAAPDADLQRLRRSGGVALQGAGERAAVHVRALKTGRVKAPRRPDERSRLDVETSLCKEISYLTNSADSRRRSVVGRSRSTAVDQSRRARAATRKGDRPTAIPAPRRRDRPRDRRMRRKGTCEHDRIWGRSSESG